MVWAIGNILDDTHTWQNANDRAMAERAFATGTVEEKKMAVAQMINNPTTSNAEISAQLTLVGVPPRLGYSHEPPTLEDCFDNLPAPPDFSEWDRSALEPRKVAANRMSTTRPALGGDG